MRGRKAFGRTTEKFRSDFPNHSWKGKVGTVFQGPARLLNKGSREKRMKSHRYKAAKTQKGEYNPTAQKSPKMGLEGGENCLRTYQSRSNTRKERTGIFSLPRYIKKRRGLIPNQDRLLVTIWQGRKKPAASNSITLTH